jgi:hypothetical protein
MSETLIRPVPVVDQPPQATTPDQQASVAINESMLFEDPTQHPVEATRLGHHTSHDESTAVGTLALSHDVNRPDLVDQDHVTSALSAEQAQRPHLKFVFWAHTRKNAKEAIKRPMRDCLAESCYQALRGEYRLIEATTTSSFISC